MKLLLAIPAYDRKISVETARAVLNETLFAQTAGVELQTVFAPGSSLVTHARNHCVREFMEGDADKLIFLDSDVSFEPGAVLRLAAHDVDFVGGCYRKKADAEMYPVGWLDRSELWADPKTRLLEVASLPGGFLAITRKVIEAIPHETYLLDGEAFPALFWCPKGGGEDGQFCADWSAAGGKVWLDPTLTLTHVDAAGRQYTGNIGAWLKAR